VVKKVISGAQCGADIAGLRAARRLGLETGGWMPLGWKTLDGPKPGYRSLYGLKETTSDRYPKRTEMNVRDSDATIRFAANWRSPGELCTLRMLRKHERPYFDFELEHPTKERLEAQVVAARAWLQEHQVQTLNVAGNAHVSLEPLVEQLLVAILGA
jgi:hypothetical protein